MQDPWAPVWLDDAVDPTMAAPFADVQVSDPATPVIAPGIGIPEQAIGDALSMPMPINPYGEGPPPPVKADDGPITHPDMLPDADADDGPVTQPDFVPMFADDEGPVTQPDYATQVSDLLQPGEGQLGEFRIESNAERYSENPLENPNDDERNAAIERMALEDPAGFARLVTQHQIAAANHAAEEALRASEENRGRAEQNLADRQHAAAETSRKMAELDAQASEIASRKVDPERYWSSRTTGQKLWSLVGAIAGGIQGGTAGNNSGRNSFLEDLNRTIDADIDAQKANLHNAWQGVTQRRGILADEYARTGDMFQASEAVRIAAWAGVRDELAARQQLFDPRGTTAIRLGMSIQDVTGRMAASRAAAEKAQFDQYMALREQARKDAETRAKIAADQAKLAARGAGGRSGARPVVMPKTAWGAKERIASWGPDAERAYQEYAANVQRAQSKWDAGGGGGAGGARPAGAPIAAPGSVGAGAPRAVSAAPRASGGASPASPQQPAEQAQPRYESQDAWFEQNAPAASDEEKKLFHFFDDNGSEVDPIKFASPDDAKAFRDRGRIRRQMAEKAAQVITLVKKLRGNQSTWERVRRAGPRWMNLNDPDVQELKSLHQSLGLDAIKANGMGVPTGKDVEMTANMVGGDPSGWQDIEPQLQRARETLQLEADADWETYAPTALGDPAYNRFRILPTANPDWVTKVQRRGAVKATGPEYGNTDPKQLKSAVRADDAPNVQRAAASKANTQNLEEATRYLEATGAAPSVEADTGAAALGVANSSQAVPTPQSSDFSYAGAPGGADSFAKMRTQHVNNVALLNRYVATGRPQDWKAFQAGQKLAGDALLGVTRANPHLVREYVDRYAPGTPLTIWNRDPELVARMIGGILRSGGK